jgi:hypothetical protein
MVAIGPRGTAYTAVAFEIFADLYYRTSASVSAAASHQAVRALMAEDTRPDLRAALANRVTAALQLGLAPALPYAPDLTEPFDGAAFAEIADSMGPAGFALTAVWARLSAEPAEPGMLGAAYLAADFTAQVTRRFKGRPADNDARAGSDETLRTLAALGAEAGRAATALRHLLLESLSQDPETAAAIFQGFDRLAVVYPLPLLDDALVGAMESREVA